MDGTVFSLDTSKIVQTECKNKTKRKSNMNASHRCHYTYLESQHLGGSGGKVMSSRLGWATQWEIVSQSKTKTSSNNVKKNKVKVPIKLRTARNWTWSLQTLQCANRNCVYKVSFHTVFTLTDFWWKIQNYFSLIWVLWLKDFSPPPYQEQGTI